MRGRFWIIVAVAVIGFVATTLWLAQLPFRLQRKVITKLPYEPDALLVTDLDGDEHPEVIVLGEGKPTIWVRFPMDNPSLIRFENGWAVLVLDRLGGSPPLKALPVLMAADNRLRLLRWENGKAVLDPLPSLPDVPMDPASVREGKGTGEAFLVTYRGNNGWVFILTPQGEWQFAGRLTSQKIKFRKFGVWDIYDLADLDRDGLLDALCVQWHPGEDAWVFWGGRKEETNLGIWMRYGYPLIDDLDGDGWKETVMVDKFGRLKIWRFDPKRKKLRVVATSKPLRVDWASFSLRLFDLNGDGLEEIVVHEFGGNCRVFRFREGKLRMWQRRIGNQLLIGIVRLANRSFLVGARERSVQLFPPRIWLGGWRVQWRGEVKFSTFCLLPKGEEALSSSRWRFQEAPFSLEFAADIDGDESEEVVGYDGRWGRYRLYRAEVTKAGKLRWQGVLLGKGWVQDCVLLVDGERRGLVLAWDDGRLELIQMAVSSEW